MEVVEKSLYVKEEEGSDMSGLDAGLCRVCHGKDGVYGRMAVARPKLVGWQELEVGRV